MSRNARGDVALLCTLDQLIFWNFIAHKKESLVLVVCLFLNDTFFKTLKGGNFCRKTFQILFFMLYYTNYITYYMQWVVFPSSTDQIVNPCS